MRVLLALFGAANCLTYALLLPLWEGFDEPFHFAYAQYLSANKRLPDPQTTRLSREVESSLYLAPASHVVKQNLPQVMTFSEYFELPAGRRTEMRMALDGLPKHLREKQGEISNYEAHQAPLAYLFIAVIEATLSDHTLPHRVLCMRIIFALLGLWILWHAMFALAELLGLDAVFQTLFVFVVLSSQMMTATLSHVANDYLSVPLASVLLARIIAYHCTPTLRNALTASLTLIGGLWAKAYFLAFLPIFFGVVASQRRQRHMLIAIALVASLGGPWYIRNVLQTSTLTGMQEARAGMESWTVVRTVPQVKWATVLPATARAMLWTGNNSFETFSRATLNIVITIWTIALIIWWRTRRGAPEYIASMFCASFLLALAYSAAQSAAFTGKMAAGPSPWYGQVIVPALLLLAVAGLARAGTGGLVIACVCALFSAYITIATYVSKLIPMYGGVEGPSTLALVWNLYTSSRSEKLWLNLQSVMITDHTAIVALTIAVCILAIIIAGALCRKLVVRLRAA